ncbi:diguanylate phosphodiesterase [Halothiobacillus diazotrophicus]|uniref:Diguanylate phosphodiesterase n=1 Tax=Halothiobacillus diazotrophicus TaxID=1860122 RepID=A0A191ZEJ7_9GAMM|nr:EAL domain-containing response regulator [Halothiobacillus diazotrophicus]ANJ66301.1 diguanylate phosphodiesterase [Halothiobacillus diazotrophicus]
MIDTLNLLVIEDDDFQRRMLVTMLNALGATSVAVASNGRQALEQIHHESGEPIHVALCDLNMPEMDGLEFLRHLSQLHHDVAVIIISAMDSRLLELVQRMAAMYDIHLLGSIEKPISLERLKNLLNSYRPKSAIQIAEEKPAPFSLDEIRQGISEAQFEPFFQPKVDFKSGAVIGAEALARWRHPDHGIIAPQAFIPLLEERGNIDDLTFLMLERSAMACKELHESGYPISISINLSRVSLHDATLADKIAKVVLKTGLDPKYIILEITETAAMTDVAHALENLARLCMKGFALSIDDYGTGYSSLQQLTRIAFSELKIDQFFVKDLVHHESLRIVVQSSIDMARRLGVKSVAEGVETQADWEMLASLGCDTAQGYYIARPMDFESFRQFIPRAGVAALAQNL